MCRKRFQFKAESPHPLRHQRAIKLDPVAGVDNFLPIKRQAVGVFGDGDHRQQRLGGNAALDNVRGSGGLDDAVGVLKRVFRPAGDNHTEARRLDIQTLSNVLADLDLLLAVMFRRNLRLDHHLDPLKMRSKRFARSWRALLRG